MHTWKHVHVRAHTSPLPSPPHRVSLSNCFSPHFEYSVSTETTISYLRHAKAHAVPCTDEGTQKMIMNWINECVFSTLTAMSIVLSMLKHLYHVLNTHFQKTP